MSPSDPPPNPLRNVSPSPLVGEGRGGGAVARGPHPAPPSIAHRVRPIDWRGWIALTWASWFGLLYARMILAARAPGLLAALRRLWIP
jgi:hypothetical protein